MSFRTRIKLTPNLHPPNGPDHAAQPLSTAQQPPLPPPPPPPHEPTAPPTAPSTPPKLPPKDAEYLDPSFRLRPGTATSTRPINGNGSASANGKPSNNSSHNNRAQSPSGSTFDADDAGTLDSRTSSGSGSVGFAVEVGVHEFGMTNGGSVVGPEKGAVQVITPPPRKASMKRGGAGKVGAGVGAVRKGLISGMRGALKPVRRATSDSPNGNSLAPPVPSPPPNTAPASTSTSNPARTFLPFLHPHSARPTSPSSPPTSPPATTSSSPPEDPEPSEGDAGISLPWNFQHSIHVDDAFTGLPPSWSSQLPEVGFSPSEIAAMRARGRTGPAAPRFPEGARAPPGEAVMRGARVVPFPVGVGMNPRPAPPPPRPAPVGPLPPPPPKDAPKMIRVLPDPPPRRLPTPPGPDPLAADEDEDERVVVPVITTVSTPSPPPPPPPSRPPPAAPAPVLPPVPSAPHAPTSSTTSLSSASSTPSSAPSSSRRKPAPRLSSPSPPRSSSSVPSSSPPSPPHHNNLQLLSLPLPAPEVQLSWADELLSALPSSSPPRTTTTQPLRLLPHIQPSAPAPAAPAPRPSPPAREESDSTTPLALSHPWLLSAFPTSPLPALAMLSPDPPRPSTSTVASTAAASVSTAPTSPAPSPTLSMDVTMGRHQEQPSGPTTPVSPSPVATVRGMSVGIEQVVWAPPCPPLNTIDKRADRERQDSGDGEYADVFDAAEYAASPALPSSGFMVGGFPMSPVSAEGASEEGGSGGYPLSPGESEAGAGARWVDGGFELDGESRWPVSPEGGSEEANRAGMSESGMEGEGEGEEEGEGLEDVLEHWLQEDSESVVESDGWVEEAAKGQVARVGEEQVQLPEAYLPLVPYLLRGTPPPSHSLTLIALGTHSHIYTSAASPSQAAVAYKHLPHPTLDTLREVLLQLSLEHAHLLGAHGVWVLPSDPQARTDGAEEQEPELRGHEVWVRMPRMERSLAEVCVLSGEGLALGGERVVARLMRDVLEALEHLHRRGVAHRDVRSDNLLFSMDGRLLLADFYHAVQLTEEQPTRSEVVGVWYWMAPELRAGTPYTAAVDLYSLGATLWELLEGVPPHSEIEDFQALVALSRLPPLSAPERWSDRLRAFLDLCAEEPERRPSAALLLETPFIKMAGPREDVVDLLDRARALEAEIQRNAVEAESTP